MAHPPESFEDFFDLVYPQAEKVARRMTGSAFAAEDVAAEALARAYARWPRVQRHAAPEAWVLRTTINLAIDRARRRDRFIHSTGRQRVVPLDHTADRSTTAATTTPEDQVAVRLALVESLHRLPKRQRHVVAMRYLADMSEADVAAALGISAGSVKTHLHRALHKLRRELDPNADLLPALPTQPTDSQEPDARGTTA